MTIVYSDHMYPKDLLILYCFHIYFLLEFILAIVATLAQVLLGMELEPQFNEPYLSTSLQDFWGRRWNLMVTNTLRITVYNSTQHAFVTHGINKKWAPLIVVFVTFVVSGLIYAWAYFLPLVECESHVGGHLVLPFIWFVFGCWGCLEDGGFYWRVTVAMADFGAFGNQIYVHYLILAVFPIIPPI